MLLQSVPPLKRPILNVVYNLGLILELKKICNLKTLAAHPIAKVYYNIYTLLQRVIKQSVSLGYFSISPGFVVLVECCFVLLI